MSFRLGRAGLVAVDPTECAGLRVVSQAVAFSKLMKNRGYEWPRMKTKDCIDALCLARRPPCLRPHQLEARERMARRHRCCSSADTFVLKPGPRRERGARKCRCFDIGQLVGALETCLADRKFLAPTETSHAHHPRDAVRLFATFTSHCEINRNAVSEPRLRQLPNVPLAKLGFAAISDRRQHIPVVQEPF
jgi:hypothetical protein